MALPPTVYRTPSMNPPAPAAVTDPSPALSTQNDTTTPRFAKLKREAEKQQENDSIDEDYYPWGRPGGGAPIRSESGNLLTDYRTRGRVAEVTGKAKRRRQEDGKFYAHDPYMYTCCLQQLPDGVCIVPSPRSVPHTQRKPTSSQ